MKYSNYRKEIVEAGKRLYDKGLIASLDGNISCRIGDDKILITPSGLCKGEMKPSDLIVTDLGGNVLSGGSKPSSETRLHLAVYETRPDVNAVVHAHPPVATAFAAAGIALDKNILTETVMFLGSIKTAEYATPTTAAVAESVRNAIVGSDGLLLANHGALTVGRTVTEAFHRMAALEHFAIVSLNARLLGGGIELPEEEVRKLLAFRN